MCRTGRSYKRPGTDVAAHGRSTANVMNVIAIEFWLRLRVEFLAPLSSSKPLRPCISDKFRSYVGEDRRLDVDIAERLPG